MKKEYVLYDSTFINSRKCLDEEMSLIDEEMSLIYSDKKEISGCLGMMRMRRREREG